MNDLVQRLTEEQPVQASLRPEASVENFKAAVDRGYVHVLFPNTQGGTELGVELDGEASDLSTADFDAGSGAVTVVGNLVLDYVRVRLHATIELETLEGTGRLEVLEDEAAEDGPEDGDE